MMRESATNTTVCIVIIGLFQESWKCKVLSGKKINKVKNQQTNKKTKQKRRKKERKNMFAVVPLNGKQREGGRRTVNLSLSVLMQQLN